MYLSKIKLWNFRKFGSVAAFDLERPNLNLVLKNGLNVLIGENDTGKSAIIDAIRLVLGTHSLDWNRVTDDDFYSGSVRLRIELTLEGMSEEEAKNFIEWLGWTHAGSTVTTHLHLIYDVRRSSEKILPAEVRAGSDYDGSSLPAEAREYLKCTYLRPLRDAQAELVPKRNSRLSRIFLGHAAFKGKENDHHLVTLFQKFNQAIENYFEGKDETGVILPDSQGKQLKREVDTFIEAFCSSGKSTEIAVADGSLKNVLERLILSIKDELNPGLGTLNRLFMAAELVHLSNKNWHGLRLALIEELEAHLHPQAQMQIIEELQRQPNIQLILTTHSPNLASKVKLASLLLCNRNQTFPMGQDFTLLDPNDYIFLECFLDVTKSNLFFANGIIMVEGWAEEILIPALAQQMKSRGIISKNLTECGVSVVNVAGTSFLRYSKIFQRPTEPFMEIPVAVISDIDVREYKKIPKCDEHNNVQKDSDGKVAYDYIKLSDDVLLSLREAATNSKTSEYNKAPVKSFLAPYWTLEYSLLNSPALSATLTNSLIKAHPRIDSSNIEIELARKLINRGLDKTSIAYDIANTLAADSNKPHPEIIFDEHDVGVGYLVKAIKYACGN